MELMAEGGFISVYFLFLVDARFFRGFFLKKKWLRGDSLLFIYYSGGRFFRGFFSKN